MNIIKKIRGLKYFKNINISVYENCHFSNIENIQLSGFNNIYQGVTIIACGKNSFVMGKNSNIHRYSILQSAGGFIHIGDNVNIGDFCFLSGQGGLTIGNNVLCSSFVNIIPNQHCYADINKPIYKQPCISQGITIGDDSWIGINATILDGVNIGKHCIVGGGSVVTKDIPDFTVVVGNPAKPIKRYNNDTKVWEKIL